MRAGLYLVALPIGNLGDMSFRGVEVLREADEIWAEDTRNLRNILGFFDIELAGRNLVACHDHNEQEMVQRLVDILHEGRVVAYVSDAGMPVISDPGFRLVKAVMEAGLYYTVLPGASAVPTGLALSGLPSDRFAFLGFVPNKDQKRRQFFEEMKALSMTVIVFESPRRVQKSLETARDVLGGDLQMRVIREISKKFEEVISGDLDEVLRKISERELKGEIVLAFGAIEIEKPDEEAIAQAVAVALETMRMNAAVKLVAQELDVPRNQVYEIALRLVNQSG